MIIYEWTPQGRKAHTVGTKEYAHTVRCDLQALVREAAYHVIRLQASGHPQDEEYSRSVNLYELACELLRKYTYNADTFIHGFAEVKVSKL